LWQGGNTQRALAVKIFTNAITAQSIIYSGDDLEILDLDYAVERMPML
jgi:hypothetical protein